MRAQDALRRHEYLFGARPAPRVRTGAQSVRSTAPPAPVWKPDLSYIGRVSGNIYAGDDPKLFATNFGQANGMQSAQVAGRNPSVFNPHGGESTGDYIERIRRTPSQMAAAFGVNLKEHLYLDGALEFVGGIIASPVSMAATSNALIRDPMGFARATPEMLAQTVQSLNVFDSSIDRKERVKRILNAGATLAGGWAVVGKTRAITRNGGMYRLARKMGIDRWEADRLALEAKQRSTRLAEYAKDVQKRLETIDENGRRRAERNEAVGASESARGGSREPAVVRAIAQVQGAISQHKQRPVQLLDADLPAQNRDPSASALAMAKLRNPTIQRYYVYGRISDLAASRAIGKIVHDLRGRIVYVDADHIKHIFDEHGNEPGGQVSIKPLDFDMALDVINDHDSVHATYHEDGRPGVTREGQSMITFAKRYNDGATYVVTAVLEKSKRRASPQLRIHSMYRRK